MYLVFVTSWREHRAQRAKVRSLRLRLVTLCAGLTEETDEYLALNSETGQERDKLPSWQRLSLFTDPDPRRRIRPTTKARR